MENEESPSPLAGRKGEGKTMVATGVVTGTGEYYRLKAGTWPGKGASSPRGEDSFEESISFDRGLIPPHIAGVTPPDRVMNRNTQQGREAGAPPSPATARQAADPAAQEFPRPMTVEEMARYREMFPAMNTGTTVVAAPETPDYNCIAWTVGQTRGWYWPPRMFHMPPEDCFRIFYSMKGFEPDPSGTGEIALWKVGPAAYTHGSVRGEGHGPRWESKLGELARVQHSFEDLQGEMYGAPCEYYRRKPPAGESAPGTREDETRYSLTAPQVQETRQRALKVHGAVKSSFGQAYGEWIAFRKNPAVAHLPDPAAHCTAPSFEALTALGKGAIPLLMERMAGGDFLALQAVERIISDNPRDPSMAKLKLNPGERINSEQAMANLTVRKWLREK